MKANFASLLLVGLTAHASDIRLSGLVEFGSWRVAIIQLGGESGSISLRPGQQTAGHTLVNMNAAGGWATFRQDTNEITIRLSGATTVSAVVDQGAIRSEEHTSELQSLRHVVCRLLL